MLTFTTVTTGTVPTRIQMPNGEHGGEDATTLISVVIHSLKGALLAGSGAV